MSGPHFMQGKAEKRMRTPTWLRLGVKIQEPAFWGYTKDKRQSFLRLSFFGYKGREERKENCGDGIKSITVSI